MTANNIEDRLLFKNLDALTEDEVMDTIYMIVNIVQAVQHSRDFLDYFYIIEKEDLGGKYFVVDIEKSPINQYKEKKDIVDFFRLAIKERGLLAREKDFIKNILVTKNGLPLENMVAFNNLTFLEQIDLFYNKLPDFLATVWFKQVKYPNFFDDDYINYKAKNMQNMNDYLSVWIMRSILKPREEQAENNRKIRINMDKGRDG